MSNVPNPDWLLLEDGPLIAVSKPAGLLTEGVPEGIPTMVGEVKDWLARKYGKDGNVYLGIPHRLDRTTSGVLVFARNSKAAARVAEQFEHREVSKLYWALLERPPEPATGLLEDWLLKIKEESRSEVVSEITPGAKNARLTYRTLGTSRYGTLVEVQLLTGRMHQIRVQFGSRGWPVVGDSRYGGHAWQIESDDPAMPQATELRVALHARSLTLFHPIRYDLLTLEAPVPGYWSL